jgi:hypothetical protein
MVMMAFGLSIALSGCQQDDTLKSEVEQLKETQEKTAKDLEEIKKLLQAKSPPKRAEFEEAVVDIDTDPFVGDKLAKVTLIEVYDFQ